MRRSSLGVQSPEELLAARREQCEKWSPNELIRALDAYITDERRARLRAIIGQRLRSVTVLFDSPYDPHNGAAVMRTAEAFGLARIHIVEEGSNGFLAAGSVARGTHKWMDVECHREPGPALAALKSQSMELIAAHPDGELEPHDLRSIPSFALVVGNERDGIQPQILQACSRRVRVPMRGFVESLNVSVTTAILLHAAVTGREGDLPEAEREKLYARGLFFSAKNAERILEALYGVR